MSLIRCTQLLSGKNATILNVFKRQIESVQTVSYSSDKNPSDNDDKQEGKSVADKTKNDKKQEKSIKETKSLPQDSKSRLNTLLKKLSSRSSLKTVNEVRLSKPLGYQKLRENQQIDAQPKKPRNIRDAAKAVSTELGDKRIETEILQPMGNQGLDSEFLDNVIARMKPKVDGIRVGSFKAQEDTELASNENTVHAKRRQRIFSTDYTKNQTSTTQIKNPFAGEPIGIFTASDSLKTKEDSLKTWQKVEEYDLHSAMSLAPRNYFEKMAYWTEEGKIWHFPIDNEQGLDVENQTSFTDHVFLEEHLEPWCPHKGAVRNFMELVCIGLSKNPYYTVQQKREHIEWYRNYFHEKRDILERIIEANKKIESAQVTDGTKST